MEPEESNISIINKPKIEHIVISGGSVSGWGNLGILRKSHEQGFWNIQDIKTVYGTSMGSILGTFLCLLNSTPYTQNYIYNWDILEDYFVKRPWQNVLKIDLASIMNSFQNRGIFDISVIREMFDPVFRAMDISMDVTIHEFFEMTQIEMHIYTIELSTFKLIDISYKTHGDWKLVEAVYCSACIPFLFRPHKRDDGFFYVDGGFLLNYPLRPCLEKIIEENTKKESMEKTGILGIYRKETNRIESIQEESSLFDYVICIFNKIMKELGVYQKTFLPKTPDSVFLYETHLPTEFFSLYKIFQFTSCIKTRIELLEAGKNLWIDTYQEYLEKENIVEQSFTPGLSSAGNTDK